MGDGCQLLPALQCEFAIAKEMRALGRITHLAGEVFGTRRRKELGSVHQQVVPAPYGVCPSSMDSKNRCCNRRCLVFDFS